MEEMEKYLSTIKNETHRKHLRQIFDWIMQNFPELEYKTMWNQPVFLEHNTFIIGFSAAKKHFSVSPEAKGLFPLVGSVAAPFAGLPRAAARLPVRCV